MWVLVVAFLINGEWHYQQHGPFHTQEQCEAANVRILMHVMTTGIQAKGDCGMRL